jgi:hypothetical protein
MSELRKLDFIGITAALVLKIVYFPSRWKQRKNVGIMAFGLRKYTQKSERQNRCWQSQSENDKSKLALVVFM